MNREYTNPHSPDLYRVLHLNTKKPSQVYICTECGAETYSDTCICANCHDQDSTLRKAKERA